MTNAYERLEQKFARIAVLNEASAMLGWDAAAMMPDGGAEARGEQLATLAGLAHEVSARQISVRTWKPPRRRRTGRKPMWA